MYAKLWRGRWTRDSLTIAIESLGLDENLALRGPLARCGDLGWMGSPMHGCTIPRCMVSPEPPKETPERPPDPQFAKKGCPLKDSHCTGIPTCVVFNGTGSFKSSDGAALRSYSIKLEAV